MVDPVVLTHCDSTQNMARFYVLSIEDSLFGHPILVRRWGRLGTNGQYRLELHDSPEDALRALEEWVYRKQRRGYQILPAD